MPGSDAGMASRVALGSLRLLVVRSSVEVPMTLAALTGKPGGPARQAMPDRDACRLAAVSMDVRDTPAPSIVSVVCTKTRMGDALGDTPGGRYDADRVDVDEMAAKLVKDGVPVAVLLGVLLAVSLLDADVVAVPVDDGVAPVVSDAVGAWLLLRVPLRVPVPDALAPGDRLDVDAADGDAPKDTDAAALSEREKVAVDEPDGDT